MNIVHLPKYITKRFTSYNITIQNSTTNISMYALTYKQEGESRYGTDDTTGVIGHRDYVQDPSLDAFQIC